jgi:hypothetical protein
MINKMKSQIRLIVTIIFLKSSGENKMNKSDENRNNTTAAGALPRLAALLLFAVLFCISCKAKSDEISLITLFVGDVQVKSGDAGFRPAKLRQTINKNDEIKTGEKSLAVIQLGTEGIVQLSENSAVTMKSLLNEKTREVFLGKGMVLSRIDKLLKGCEYQVKTPTVIAAVRGTQFIVRISAGKSIVALDRGTVLVALVQTGEKASIDAGKAAEVTDKIQVRDISVPEKKELERLQSLEITPDAAKIDNEEFERIEKEQIAEIDRLARESGETGAAMNAYQIRAKYGRVDQLIDYSGRTYFGVILKRGSAITMLTASGIVNIPNPCSRNVITFGGNGLFHKGGPLPEKYGRV